MAIHKTAASFAIKHHITLGRLSSGYYYIRNADLSIWNYSGSTTARSALALMRKYRRAS